MHWPQRHSDLMNDKSPDNQPKQESIGSSVDATIGFEPTTPAVGNQSGIEFKANKQYRDLAFAAVALRSGHITERQLARATVNWTSHGGQRLSDHLIAEQLITPAQRDQLQQRIKRELDRISNRLSQQPSLPFEEQDRLWLSTIDRSGKLGKLLGIADDSMLPTSDNPARKVNARYTLLRKLGQGGLGTVWLARDENLRRYVAVKEITNKFEDDEQASAHFRREAEITGRLEHPGIVPIYQFGMDAETGRGFYAMRFLGKRTLQDALVEYHERRESGNEDPMMLHRLLTAFVNVCQAVAHAHSKNVIHRDLKPDNIALDSFGQVVLLDWGLAKVDEDTGMYEVDGHAEPGDLHSVGATQASRVLGTPLYMAPEQASGRLDEVDHLTDVYGLGGILFAILTGVAPHEDALDSESNRKSTDVFSTIVSRPVRTPREVLPDVSPELDAICNKALATKRYLRYDSAAKLAEDIQRYMAGASVTAYEAPLKQRIKRWMALHPTSSQLLLLLASLIVIGGAAIGFTARRGRVALQQERFSGLKEFTRELEINLQFDAQELVQDIRFITELPLMQATVISSQSGNSADSEDEAGKDSEAEAILGDTTPEQWIERHGNLFDALMRANPAYLVMTSCELKEGMVREVVRSQRFSSGMNATKIPKSQLVSIETDESIERIRTLRPGEAMMMTGDQLPDHVPTRNRSPLTLIAVGPVYDEHSGELFGFNVIELDLRKRLEDLFVAVAPEDVTVYVADATGDVALMFRDGQSLKPKSTSNVLSKFDQLEPFFAESAHIYEFGNGKNLYAMRVPLGLSTISDQPQAQILIVAHIE